MLITTDLVMDHDPCSAYTEERLNDILGDGMELAEVLKLNFIDIDDRTWLATRKGILTREQIQKWVEKIITEALIHIKQAYTNTNDTWEEWADNWLEGTDRTEESAIVAIDIAGVNYTMADAAEAATAYPFVVADKIDSESICYIFSYAASATAHCMLKNIPSTRYNNFSSQLSEAILNAKERQIGYVLEILS